MIPGAGEFGHGIGVDIESIDRFKEPDGRLFSTKELVECESRVDAAECRAGKWCAKEAVVKAGSKFILLSPREVEILSGETGAPLVSLGGRAERLGLKAEVSISHSGGLAIAVAQVWRAHPNGR